MKPAIGQTLVLNHVEYYIRELLGSGAVAEVYLATLAARPGSEVVIKLVSDDQVRRLEEDGSGQAPLLAEDRRELLRTVDGLRQEARVLEILNRAEDAQWPSVADALTRLRRAEETRLERRIIALLDSGELGAFQPFVVQEKAPAVFERFDLSGWQDERRLLAVGQAIAGAIGLAHQHGLALADFEPHTKGDRIRLRWLDTDERTAFELKIIDWNVTGDRGQMAQDLFFFGEHLYYFFLGSYLALDKENQPPTDLGMDSLRSPGWSRLTEGSRQLLQKMLHRDPRRRYPTAARLEEDLTWWCEALKAAGAPNALDRLQDRLWQARREERSDRVLAAADLALRLDPPSQVRENLELRATEARDRLEEEIWRPISQARATLMTGAYAKAVSELDQLLGALPADGEPARRARIYLRLARAGDLLKVLRQGADVRTDGSWRALDRAADALVKRRWGEARDALHEISRIEPALAAWQPVVDLSALARAGLHLEEASDLAAQAEPHRADSGRTDWAVIEKGQIALLARAVEKLQAARDLAPLEPGLTQQWRIAQDQLGLRQQLLERYQRAETLMSQGTESARFGRMAESTGDYAAADEVYRRAVGAFQEAAGELNRILEADAGQYRAAELLKRMQPDLRAAEERRQATTRQVEAGRQADEALSQAQSLLPQGSYASALRPLERAAALLPERDDLKDWLARAKAGARVERQAQGNVETARQYLRMRNLDEAQGLIEQCRGFSGRPLAELAAGERLSESNARYPFSLDSNLSARVTLLADKLPVIKIQRRDAQQARQAGEHSQVIELVNGLENDLRAVGEELTEEELSWRDGAQKGIDALAEAETILGATPDIERITEVLNGLKGDPGEKARALGKQAGMALLGWIDRQKDLTLNEKLELLEHGSRLPLEQPVLEELRRWQNRAATGLAIERELAMPGEQPWPTWLEDKGADERLRRLADNLSKLEGNDCRPVTPEQVRSWQEQSKTCLEAYLSDRLKAARQASLSSDFDHATEVVGSVRTLVPEQLRPPVWQEVDKLDQALQARRQVDAAMKRSVRRLGDPGVGFQSVQSHVQETTPPLPCHPDVPVADLEALVDNLKNAAAMEQSLRDPVVNGDYAAKIARLLAGIEKPLEALESPTLSFLADEGIRQEMANRLSDLRSKQRDAISPLADTLVRELSQQGWALRGDASGDSAALLSRYWQALWLRDAAPKMILAHELDGALTSVVTATKALATQLAKDVYGLDSLEAMGRVLTSCKRLQQLNQGLTSMPSEGQMPPLPPGAHRGDVPRVLDAAALDRVSQALTHLSDLSRRPIESQALPPMAHDDRLPATTPAPDATALKSRGLWGWWRRGQRAPAAITPKPTKPASQDTPAAEGSVANLQKVTEELIRLKEQLKSLGEGLKALNPEQPEDTIAGLSTEIVFAEKLTRDLIGAERDRLDGKADVVLGQIGGLTALTEDLEPAWTWLFGPEQMALKAFVRALDSRLDADLQEQVNQAYRDPSKAVSRLGEMGVRAE